MFEGKIRRKKNTSCFLKSSPENCANQSIINPYNPFLLAQTSLNTEYELLSSFVPAPPKSSGRTGAENLVSSSRPWLDICLAGPWGAKMGGIC